MYEQACTHYVYMDAIARGALLAAPYTVEFTTPGLNSTYQLGQWMRIVWGSTTNLEKWHFKSECGLDLGIGVAWLLMCCVSLLDQTWEFTCKWQPKGPPCTWIQSMMCIQRTAFHVFQCHSRGACWQTLAGSPLHLSSACTLLQILDSNAKGVRYGTLFDMVAQQDQLGDMPFHLNST